MSDQLNVIGYLTAIMESIAALGRTQHDLHPFGECEIPTNDDAIAFDRCSIEFGYVVNVNERFHLFRAPINACKLFVFNSPLEIQIFLTVSRVACDQRVRFNIFDSIDDVQQVLQFHGSQPSQTARFEFHQ